MTDEVINNSEISSHTHANMYIYIVRGGRCGSPKKGKNSKSTYGYAFGSYP